MPKKRVAKEMKVSDLVSDASGEAESLKEELENWRDGITGTNLENSEKYQNLGDAIDQLDKAYSTLQEVQDCDEKLIEDIVADESLIKPKSRPKRLSRIIENLEHVIQRLDEVIEELEKEIDQSGNESDLVIKDGLEEFQSDVSRALDELQEVEIPVPFG